MDEINETPTQESPINATNERRSRKSSALSAESSTLIEEYRELCFQPMPKQSKVRKKLGLNSKANIPLSPYADSIEDLNSSRNGHSQAKPPRSKQGNKPSSIGSPQSESPPFQTQPQPSKVRSKFVLNSPPKMANSNSLPQLKSLSAGNAASLTGGFNTDFDKMKEKIDELEQSNEKLTYLLNKKDLDFQTAEHQLHKLLLELDKSKRQSQEMLEQVEDRHRAELLNVKDAHSKDMAVLSYISIKNTYNSLDQPTGSSPSMSIEEYMEANKKLAEHVESLLKSKHKLIDEFSEEKKVIIADHSKKIFAVEKEAKAEILTLRSKIIAHEDVISSQQEELQKALSKLEVTNKLNRQLEKTRDDLTENLNRTNTEVKSLQQSLTTNFRFNY